MDKFEIGMLVRAKAGRDLGHLYIILSVDNEYVYLADGINRTCRHLKKKRKKHVQLISKKYDITKADDIVIKRILKEYKEKG